MTLPARAPYCLKCRSFTTLEKGGTECETCGSRDIEQREVEPETPLMEPPLEPRPPKTPAPVSPAKSAELFAKLRKSLEQ